jgi:hypothetical protein
VTLCRTYRRIRSGASVIRSLEAAEADSRGGISVSLLMHAVTLGLANGNRQIYDHPTPRAESGRID